MKCKILEDYLKSIKQQQQQEEEQRHQLYFSDRFLSQMRSKIRSNFMKEIKERLNMEDVLIRVMATPDGALLAPSYQNRNFLYLTGIEYSDFEVVLDVKRSKTLLFVPEHDFGELIQTSTQLKERYGMDEVYDLDKVNLVMKSLVDQYHIVHSYTIDANNNAHSMNYTSDVVLQPLKVNPFSSILNGMRDVKLDEELEIMRRASEITNHAHRSLMKFISAADIGTSGDSEMYEFQLVNHFTSLCQSCGVDQQSYLPIVASGENTVVLHYTERYSKASRGDLVLIDAGGSLLGYTTDVTRTYPFHSPFNQHQKSLYNAVLTVQRKSLNLIKENANFTTIQQLASHYLIEQLQELNVVVNGSVSVEELYQLKIHRVFMPHGLGHLIGLDVHDTTTYPSTVLKRNMVLSVEPGIYFDEHEFVKLSNAQKQVISMSTVNEFRRAKAYGVRIEDNVIVTQDGYEMLTNVPKEIEEVEML